MTTQPQVPTYSVISLRQINKLRREAIKRSRQEYGKVSQAYCLVIPGNTKPGHEHNGRLQTWLDTEKAY